MSYITQCWQRNGHKEYLSLEGGRLISKASLGPLVGRGEKFGADLGLVDVGFAKKRFFVESLSSGGGFGARALAEP